MPTRTPGTRESSAASTVVSDKFRAYPDYLDSGVEWLGKIPAHWAVKRLKHLLAESLKYGASEPAEFVDRGLPRYIRITDIRDDGTLRDDSFRSLSEETSKPYLLADGDILFARSGATVGKTFFYKSRWGRAAYAGYLIRARPDKCKIRADFVSYFTQSQTYNDWLLGNLIQATIQNVSAERYASLGISVPPGGEQRIIARFLDCETAKIDALVAKKERIIELLQEKRTGLITRAVTKGRDPDAPMKDSGVEWLGEIPTHWEALRLFRLTPPERKIMYGIVLPGPDVRGGVPIVKGGDVSPERLSPAQLNRTSPEIEARHARSRLCGGDLVYAIRGSIGDVEIVPDELEGANLTQDAARVSYTAEIHGPWLLFALKSRAVFSQLEAGALGATIRGINIRDLKRVVVPLPPPTEQRAIADHLDRETAKIDALVAKVREAIERLKELRTALVSAAVTGKIDVRGTAA